MPDPKKPGAAFWATVVVVVALVYWLGAGLSVRILMVYRPSKTGIVSRSAWAYARTAFFIQDHSAKPIADGIEGYLAFCGDGMPR